MSALASVEDKIESGAASLSHSFISIIIGAFALTSALTWNDSIKNALELWFPTPDDQRYKVINNLKIAVALTLITVLLVWTTGKLNKGKGISIPLANYYGLG